MPDDASSKAAGAEGGRWAAFDFRPPSQTPLAYAFSFGSKVHRTLAIIKKSRTLRRWQGFPRRGIRLVCLLDETSRQRQDLLTIFETHLNRSELGQVAALQQVRELLLLRGRQPRRGLHGVQELRRRLSRGRQAEAALQVTADHARQQR